MWVTGPGGERWEVYTVLADSDTFSARPPSTSRPGPPRVLRVVTTSETTDDHVATRLSTLDRFLRSGSARRWAWDCCWDGWSPALGKRDQCR